MKEVKEVKKVKEIKKSEGNEKKMKEEITVKEGKKVGRKVARQGRGGREVRRQKGIVKEE